MSMELVVMEGKGSLPLEDDMIGLRLGNFIRSWLDGGKKLRRQ